MPAPKLVNIAVEGSERYIALDSAGRVWQGRMETSRGGGTYIDWKRLDSEFQREAH
jgi:hypothetical protein